MFQNNNDFDSQYEFKDVFKGPIMKYKHKTEQKVYIVKHFEL